MLRRISLISLSLLLVLFTASLFFHVHIRSFDMAKYRKLMNTSTRLRGTKPLEKRPAFQARGEVQKDLFLIREGKRHHFRIESASSFLTLRQKGKRVDAVEELETIRAAFQEKIEDSSQEIRSFFAKKGTYTFPDHTFQAEGVRLFFYQMPGNTLPPFFSQSKPYLTGTSKTILLQAGAKTPTFSAYGIQARFDSDRYR